MPDIRKVIADTSVLIAFEKLGLLNLLCSVYEQILLPPCVFDEYSSEMQSCFIIADAPHGLARLIENQSGLGRGESEAIALAPEQPSCSMTLRPEKRQNCWDVK